MPSPTFWYKIYHSWWIYFPFQYGDICNRSMFCCYFKIIWFLEKNFRTIYICLTSWNVLFWKDGGRVDLTTSLGGLNTKDPIVWERTLTQVVKMLDANVEELPNLSTRSSRRRPSLSLIRQRIHSCFAFNFLELLTGLQVHLGPFQCFMCWIFPCKTLKMSLKAGTVGIPV